MGKRKLKTVFWVFLLLIVTGLIGCKQKEPEKEQLCHIVMEKGDGYQVTDSVRTIKSGSDVSFTVTLDNNWQLLGTDYHGETEITKDDDGKTVEIVLHEVKYSESICIQAEKGKYEILYDANGGQNTSGDSDRVSICYRGTHQRINTSIGTDLFFVYKICLVCPRRPLCIQHKPCFPRDPASKSHSLAASISPGIPSKQCVTLSEKEIRSY